MTPRRLLLRPGVPVSVLAAQVGVARRYLTRGQPVEVVCQVATPERANLDMAVPVLTKFSDLIFDAALVGPIEPAADTMTMLLTPRTPGTEGGTGVRVPRQPFPSSPPDAQRLAEPIPH